jgi:subtilisin family serine protease
MTRISSSNRVVALIAIVAAMVLGVVVPASPAAPSTQGKIAALVLQQTTEGRTAQFLVVLTAQANMAGAEGLPSKLAKGRYVVDTLRALAAPTQAPIVALLRRMGARYRSHWVVNMLRVTGDRTVVDALAARPDVARILPNPWLRSIDAAATPPRITGRRSTEPGGVEWNIRRVNAPKVWRHGDTGQGIALGIIDTGQQWNHPALKGQYRGWNGSTADHNYNWYDATDPSNRVPVDPNGHGTHITGTMVGDDGGANHIGVAPGASWMGCRALDQTGLGTPDTFTTCFEFMLAPWDLDGHNPDPAKAPVTVSIGWFCSISAEGCSQGVLFQVVKAVRTAGIVPVVAAGGAGPGCSTIGIEGPPAQYDESYTVGATDSNNLLAGFSSRGPASVPGQSLTKPDISAPGVNVRSAWPGNQYVIESGTSMAMAHIPGVVALLYAAHPELIGDVDATEAALNDGAHHIDSSACSSSGTYPNNLYGWGIVNAVTAIQG